MHNSKKIQEISFLKAMKSAWHALAVHFHTTVKLVLSDHPLICDMEIAIDRWLQVVQKGLH